MIGLSKDIQEALSTIIEGLEYDFYASGEDLDPDRLSRIMKSKVTSFMSAKKIITKWIASKNAPQKPTLRYYVKQIVDAGELSLDMLRKALSDKIDYDELEEYKHDVAIAAKAQILEYLFDMDTGVRELQEKLDNDDFDLTDKEFKLGYPERFGKGEFFPKEDYHKDWYDKRNQAIRIDPLGTNGEIITISDLKIRLPKVPEDKTEILFHDLPKKEQYWRRSEDKGVTLENVEEHEDYILEEYRRRREGIWFYNNGKPTYLTGNAYYALQWGKMFDDGKYMQFRDSQLKMFYHLEACIVDKRSLGQAFLKSRRTGFTYVILFIILNMSTSIKNGKYGMTSKSGDDVVEAFAKFSYAFLSLPFWLRPVVKGKLDSPKELFFAKPSDNSKEAKKLGDTGIKDYLNTFVDYRPTKDDSYDSIKLDGYLGDEFIKWVKPSDYIKHLAMISPTMMPNGRVVGKMFLGSTMGAHAKGGEQGIEILNGSLIKNRDTITNKTSTALYFHFLPAQDNMEEFTDIYGKCWVKRPPKGTLNVLGDEITIGSEDYLIAIEDQKRRQSDKAYAEQVRTYPRTIEHAMRDEAEECVFNMTKLEEQMEFNNRTPEEDRFTRGNFDWKNGVKDGEVVFNPRRDGRFKIAWLPTKANGMGHIMNNVRTKGGKYFPLNKDIIYFACDPFSFTISAEGSSGAIHGLTSKFPEEGIPRNDFVLEYIARPEDSVFFEDVIKMVRYYGSKILIESNRIDLNRHLYNRGYRAFAENRIDKTNDKLNDKEKKYGGQPIAAKELIASHMDATGAWIERNAGVYTNEELLERPLGEIGRMVFNETLKDWLRFNPKSRTKHDAFVSSGLAIMYQNKERYKGKLTKPDRKHVKKIFKKYTNTYGGAGRPVR